MKTRDNREAGLTAARGSDMKPFARVRAMTILMRIAALSMFLSGVTFFLPEASINSFLTWCGLERMPDATMMRYVLRAAGYLQLAYGVFIWVVARDVVRHQPIVVTSIVIFLIGAPAFYWIDAAAGLPRYWCLLDFTCCLLAGIVPLAFWLWPSSRDKRLSAIPSTETQS